MRRIFLVSCGSPRREGGFQRQEALREGEREDCCCRKDGLV